VGDARPGSRPYSVSAVMFTILFGLLLLCPLTAVAASEDEPLPFHLPTPEGWRTETIPFPLEFAPDLAYEGLEELRFSPGMFEEGHDEFWTYSFVWWLRQTDRPDIAAFGGELEAYFRGLAVAVSKAREFAFETLEVEVRIDPGEGGAFTGSAVVPDAFVTRGMVELNIEGSVRACGGDEWAVLFALSPQPRGHAAWETLRGLVGGFECPAAR